MRAWAGDGEAAESDDRSIRRLSHCHSQPQLQSHSRGHIHILKDGMEAMPQQQQQQQQEALLMRHRSLDGAGVA